MIINVQYSSAALHESAKFIWDNNPSAKSNGSIFAVMTHIKKSIQNYAIKNAKVVIQERKSGIKNDDDWVSYTGIYGYYILYSLGEVDEEQITIEATILVDAAVGHPDANFVTEVVDTVAD